MNLGVKWPSWILAVAVTVAILPWVGGCSGPTSAARGAGKRGEAKASEAPGGDLASEAHEPVGFGGRAELDRTPRVKVEAEPSLPVSVGEWVGRAFDGVEDAGLQATIAREVLGREAEYFMEVMAQAANETRDVAVAVRGAAAGLALARGSEGAAVGVREIWARECCMRRRFLAEGLRGLGDGLEGRGAVSVRDAATALSLGELSENPDPDVAEAAGALLRFFTRQEPEEE